MSSYEGNGKTPLQRAAALGSIADAERLILSGAKPDVQTRRGRSALHYASENGHGEIVALLIRSGAQIDLPNKWGRTALHYAASKHRVDCLRILINSGADPNKQDIDRQTPLYHAVAASIGPHVENNVHDTVVFLISNNASTDLPDKSGITPLHIAAELGNKQICINLIKGGRARVNAIDQHGATPLHYAAYQGHWNVAELLLSLGASAAVQDNAGVSAKSYVERRRNRGVDLTEVVDFSSCLIKLHETDGLGLVRPTSEVEKIEKDIGRYIEAALKSMIQAEPRFNCVLLQAGSTAENTKVGEPDEIDYMCVLTDLSKACYVYESPSDPPGYLRIRMHGHEMEMWKDFLDNNGFLIAEKLHLHFHSLFDRHSENADLTAMTTDLHKLRDYSNQGYVGVTVDMSQTKPGSRLFFLWRGCQFKRLVVTVDLIPAIEITGWPKNARVPPEQGADRYHVIPKISPVILNHPSAELYWRISTSMAEKRIFCALDGSARSCYTICKSLIQCSDPHLLFPENLSSGSKELRQLLLNVHRLRLYDDLINSYLIKMIFCREITTRRNSSDWSRSAVGNRVSEILNKLMGELKQGCVPSYFIRDYNVLCMELSSD